MAYDEMLAQRLRASLEPFSEKLEEKKMMGGLCFMYRGKMSCGIVKDKLMVRVIDDKYEEMLEHPHVSEMDFTGKVLKGFIYVSKEGFPTEEALTRWVDLGIEHVDQQLDG